MPDPSRRSACPLRVVCSLVVLLLLGFNLDGCSPRKDNTPPAEQVRDAFSTALPSYLAVSGVELVPSAKRSDAPYATQSYPVQLSATASQQTEVKGRWNFYCQQGPLSLVPTEQGGLEGEAVVFRRYLVRLQREP